METLAVSQCKFGEEGLSALQTAVVSNALPLKKLSLPGDLESTPAGISLKAAWLDAGKMEDDLLFETFDPSRLEWDEED